MLWKLTNSFNSIKNQKGFEKIKTAVYDTNLALPLLGLFGTGLFGLILLNMTRVWMYYFVPMLGFAAISSGAFTGSLLAGFAKTIFHKGNLKAADIKKSSFAGALILIAIMSIFIYRAPLFEKNLSYYKNMVKQGNGTLTKTYTWSDGLLPDFINNAVKSFIWKKQRTIGKRYCSLTYLLWHESRYLKVTEQIVADIQKLTDKKDLIFGDSGTVPLFALLSGRAIAINEVDTNIQRYKSRNANPKKLVEDLDRVFTKLIILRVNGRGRFGVFGVEEVQNFVKEKYTLKKIYPTVTGTRFLLFMRKSS
jgi:hypothetical protein